MIQIRPTILRIKKKEKKNRLFISPFIHMVNFVRWGPEEVLGMGSLGREFRVTSAWQKTKQNLQFVTKLLE